MKVAYFDCPSGISGDMILGALVDAGLPVEDLEKTLGLIDIEGYSINAREVKRKGIRAIKVDVIIDNSELPGRELKDIRKIIQESRLSKALKDRSLQVIERLARAEARVHNVPIEEVHFHEIAHIDTIVDIVGTLYGLSHLGIDKIYASPVNTGSGMVKTSHGLLPIPAPVTGELLKDVPIYSTGVRKELTTPTGAVLITTLASAFQAMPHMKVKSIGYGSGDWDLEEQANILRIFIGEEEDIYGTEEIYLLETNIDDMNPQIYEYLMENLFQAGALDVYITPVVMKKGRPGQVLSVLAHHEGISEIQKIIFRETSTLGIRINRICRSILERHIEEVDTPLGRVRIKKARGPDGLLHITPEYEDCKRIAMEKHLPLHHVIDLIKKGVGPR